MEISNAKFGLGTVYLSPLPLRSFLVGEMKLQTREKKNAFDGKLSHM